MRKELVARMMLINAVSMPNDVRGASHWAEVPNQQILLSTHFLTLLCYPENELTSNTKTPPSPPALSLSFQSLSLNGIIWCVLATFKGSKTGRPWLVILLWVTVVRAGSRWQAESRRKEEHCRHNYPIIVDKGAFVSWKRLTCSSARFQTCSWEQTASSCVLRI